MYNINTLMNHFSQESAGGKDVRLSLNTSSVYLYVYMCT